MQHRIRVAGLIRSGDRLLLVKQENRFGVSTWSLPGGRLEPTDDDIFRGAEREVWEETGLRVVATRLRYVSEYLATDMFAVTLILECRLAEDENPDNIHLDNIMEDDNIHEVAWWNIAELRTTEVPLSRTLIRAEFWQALEMVETTVYLGRHGD